MKKEREMSQTGGLELSPKEENVKLVLHVLLET